jgi:hypothetical protein
MTPSTDTAPDVLPLLGRGRHRHPRKGACFMELASYLAGERWSDHPACTHPLLAALARQVNDLTSDAGRDRLAPLIPSVIGLTGTDARIDALVAVRCAATALPVVAEERQRALAVSVLVGERVLAALEGRPAGALTQVGQQALAAVPLAERWARGFVRWDMPSATEYRRRSAPNTVRLSTTGVAAACVPDVDGLLKVMLQDAIGECERWADRPEPVPAPRQGWSGVLAEARAGRGR